MNVEVLKWAINHILYVYYDPIDDDRLPTDEYLTYAEVIVTEYLEDKDFSIYTYLDNVARDSFSIPNFSKIVLERTTKEIYKVIKLISENQNYQDTDNKTVDSYTLDKLRRFKEQNLSKTIEKLNVYFESALEDAQSQVVFDVHTRELSRQLLGYLDSKGFAPEVSVKVHNGTQGKEISSKLLGEYNTQNDYNFYTFTINW